MIARRSVALFPNSTRGSLISMSLLMLHSWFHGLRFFCCRSFVIFYGGSFNLGGFRRRLLRELSPPPRRRQVDVPRSFDHPFKKGQAVISDNTEGFHHRRRNFVHPHRRRQVLLGGAAETLVVRPMAERLVRLFQVHGYLVHLLRRLILAL